MPYTKEFTKQAVVKLKDLAAGGIKKYKSYDLALQIAFDGLDADEKESLMQAGEDLGGLEDEIFKENPHRDQRQESLVWYPRDTRGTGYGNNVVSLGPFPYHNVRDLLARFFIVNHTQYGKIKNWRDNCIGIISADWQTGETRHMPMFDYDGKNIKTKIRQDVKMLQKNWSLGNAWVYETRRGFHVYFFCDQVSHQDYLTMLERVRCCQGFVRAAQNQDYAVLRLSAKYTSFDIRFLYVLSSKNRELKRLPQKAHVIQNLLALGEECGTHFASMFPQWAHFAEDLEEWKASKPASKKARRPIRKTKLVTKSMWDQELLASQERQGLINFSNSTSTVTYTGNDITTALGAWRVNKDAPTEC